MGIKAPVSGRGPQYGNLPLDERRFCPAGGQTKNTGNHPGKTCYWTLTFLRDTFSLCVADYINFC